MLRRSALTIGLWLACMWGLLMVACADRTPQYGADEAPETQLQAGQVPAADQTSTDERDEHDLGYWG